MLPETPMASEAITHKIRVKVRSFYIPERSDPAQRQFFYAYRIRIENEGDAPAQLLRRHWIITDALGDVEEVRGDGVVGEQPLLEPGQCFEYTSACPLATQYGTMHGTYEFINAAGDPFTVVINPFELYVPALAN